MSQVTISVVCSFSVCQQIHSHFTIVNSFSCVCGCNPVYMIHVCVSHQVQLVAMCVHSDQG